MSGGDDGTDSGAQSGRDHETVARLRSGDPEGLRHLLEDHGGLVRARLRQLFGKMLDNAEIDDVMNLASMRAWQAAPRFDDGRGTLRAWLSVIARNCALRLLEERRRSPIELRASLDEWLPSRAAGTAASAERQRLSADLAACLARLPTLQRAVLRADLDAGLSVPAEELAKRLSTSANSIYVSRLKGRRALRAALQALGHFRDEPGAAPQDGAAAEAEQA